MKSVIEGLIDAIEYELSNGPRPGESKEEFEARIEKLQSELYDEQCAEADYGWENEWFASEMNDCLVNKDIGMYNTCRHFRVYCYANTSKEFVLRNTAKHNDESESIIDYKFNL